jgi:nitrite reductase (NO-forming)
MRRFIIILFVILFIVAIILISKKTKPEDLKVGEVKSTTQTETQSNSFVDATDNGQPSSVAKNVVDVTVDGSNFSFTPSIIKVKQGDTVNVTFVNKDGFHDFKIDEYNVATKQIKGGEQEKVTFVASKKGSFEYYCSVGTHRQMGMKGTLVVE